MSDLIKEIQPDFSHSSNFVEKSNESSVRFGANTQILEVELNELQEIQNKAKEDLIRDSIPSGFIITPTINTIYTTENIDKLRINNTPVAYVNGMRIEIPSSTFIDIGEPPEKDVREDLVFLEVWQEVVDGNATLTLNGGEGLGKLPNKIIDPRMGEETSRRVVTRWRIRCIQDMNFDFKGDASTIGNSPNPYIGWLDNIKKTKAYAKGANPNIEEPTDISGREVFRGASANWSNAKVNSDTCLWVAGIKNEKSSIERFKTVDGLVYAIPMFKLTRRPSTGVLKGDYTSIAPTCDYDKVQNILAEEKVSGINAGDVTLELEGKTLRNLHPKRNYSFACDPVNDNYYTKSEGVNSVSVSVTNVLTSWRYFNCGAINKDLFKPSTTYTIVGEFKNVGIIRLQSDDGKYMFSTGCAMSNNKAVITTLSQAKLDSIPKDKEIVVYCYMTDTIDTKSAKNVMVFEGELSAEIPKYLEGIQSVGEDKVAFKKFLSYKTSVTNGVGDNNIAQFSYKPESNLVKFVPVGVDGKEIIDLNIAYSLKAKGGAEGVTWLQTTDAKVLTDEQREKIDTVIIYCNESARTNSIIGFNIYDGYCIRLKSEIDGNRSSLLDINLKEPLREYNGVKDLVNNNGLVVRNIAKRQLRASDEWFINDGWSKGDTIAVYNVVPDKKMGQTNMYCKEFKTRYIGEISSSEESIFGEDDTKVIYVRILKSRLKTPDLAGFKEWLSENYIEVLYDRDNYAPLQSLPNGFGDVDDGMGTITRNIKQVTFNGSESWNIADDNSYIYMSALSYNCANPFNAFCDSLKTQVDSQVDKNIYITANTWVIINRQYTTLEEYKAWLQANPIKVSYQLEVPTIETYSTERAEFVGDLLFNNCNADIVCENNIVPKINLTHKADMKVDLVKDYTKVASNCLVQPTITVKDQVGLGSVELTPSANEENVPVKIEGNTYQNLVTNRLINKDIKQADTSPALCRTNLFKNNTTYTAIYRVNSVNSSEQNMTLNFKSGGGAPDVSLPVQTLGLNKKAFTLNNVLPDYYVLLYFFNKDNTANISDCMILEGDWTNKEVPEEYFEGIMSVMDKNRNLFDGTIGNLGFTSQNKFSVVPDGTIKSVSFECKASSHIISGIDNIIQNCNSNAVRVFWSEQCPAEGVSYSRLDNITLNYTKMITTVNYGYLTLSFLKDTPWENFDLSTLQIEEGTVVTQYEPYYIGNKLSILATGKNLFDKDKFPLVENRALETDRGTIYTTTSKDWYAVTEYIPIPPFNEGMYLSATERSTICFYDINKNYIGFSTSNDKKTIPTNAKYFRFDAYRDYVQAIQIELTNDGVSTEYQPYLREKKQISLPIDGLKSLPNGVCDAIEQRGEESYLVQRVGKVVFNGSSDEVWSLQSINSNNFANFLVRLPYANKLRQNSMCNLFIVDDNGIANTTREGYHIVDNSTELYIRILSTKANTVPSFKNWLKENPITVYYELAEPIVTQLTSNLVTEGERTTFALEGQVGYKRTDEGGVLAESLLLTQDLNPNWHQVGEVRKYKYTLNRGSILDLLDVPLIPGSQLGNDDSLACPYKMKIIKVLPNNECLVKNIGKNTMGGQAEQFVVPQFLSTRLFKDDIEEIYPRVSLTGWDYNQLLEETLLKILK